MLFNYIKTKFKNCNYNIDYQFFITFNYYMFDNCMYMIIIVQGNHECKCSAKRKYIQ